MPGAIPVTTPEAVTVAVPTDVELHTPPAAPSLKVVVAPTQTIPEPDRVPAFGNALTVATTVTLQPAPFTA